MRYCFAELVFDLRRGTLTGPAGAIHLRPQAYKLLEVLVARAPGIVSHEELLDRVWGTRHLSPSSLKQAISELRQALGDPHEAPLLIETVHRRGYRFIAAVAAEEEAEPPPAEKTAAVPAAGEVPAAGALAAPAAPAGEPLPPAPAPVPPSRGRRMLGGLAGLALLLLAVLAWRASGPDPPAPAPASGPRPVAALFLFAAPSPSPVPDLAWAPTAVAELLAIELASGGGVQVLGGDEVARLRRELQMEPAAPLDGRALERIRAYLGCDLVLRGALRLAGERGESVGLELALLDARSARTLFAGDFEGRLEDLAALARQIALRLQAEVLPPAMRETAAGGPRWRGADPARALRLYATGLERLRAGEAVAARDLLLAAAAADGENALVFRALARAHQELGYVAPARAAAQRAFELAGGLPRELRLDIEGQLHLSQRSFAEAAEVFGALHRFFPDDLDHGLQLAAALAKNQQPAAAAEVLARLRLLPPPRGDHPSIDLEEAAVFEGSDPQRAFAAAREAARKAAARGASLLVARARRDEGWLLYRLSRFDEALATLGEAEALFRAAGDRAKVASVLATRASVLSARGARPEARPLFEEAVRISREIGNPGSEAQALNNFAAMSGTDDIPLTRALLRRSLEIKVQLGDLVGEAFTRLNLANLARFEGRLAEARELTAGALELYRQLDDKYRIAFTLRTLGSLLAKEGRLEEAAERFTEALETSRLAGDTKGEADAWYELGLLRLLQHDDEGALEKVRRSREIYDRLGLVDDTILSDLQVGDILWERGEREAAREIYRAAAARREEIGSERVRKMLDRRLAEGPEPLPGGGGAAASARTLGGGLRN